MPGSKEMGQQAMGQKDFGCGSDQGGKWEVSEEREPMKEASDRLGSLE